MDVVAEIRFLQAEKIDAIWKVYTQVKLTTISAWQLSIVDDAAAYQARRLRTPLCFCVYIRISVNINLEQQSPHIKPDWIYGRQGEAPQSCGPFFFVFFFAL